MSDHGMGEHASQPDPEVDDGSIDADRHADERRQIIALGMWSITSDGEIRFTKSGPIPNRR